MMRRLEVRLFVEDSGVLSEGPFWFENRLWWVDIESGMLHTVEAAGADRRSHSFGRRIGAAAPTGDGRCFVVALEDGIGVLDRESGRIEILADPEKEISGSRFNDGKCDPSGRFLAGTLNMNGRKESSALYQLDRHGLRKILYPVTLSNGLAWSPDGKILYYIDSPTREIAAFAYDAETGSLGGRRVVVKTPPELGVPDGMDIDCEGNLWAAHWGSSVVRCWSPANGECLAEISLPCKRPSSCCFGGPKRDQLFITTAKTGGEEDEQKTHPLSGSIFVCEPGVSGFEINTCSCV